LLFDCPTPRALAHLLAETLLGGAEPPVPGRVAEPEVPVTIGACSEEELALMLSRKLDALDGGSTK
jgi:hypothetical protein